MNLFKTALTLLFLFNLYSIQATDVDHSDMVATESTIQTVIINKTGKELVILYIDVDGNQMWVDECYYPENSVTIQNNSLMRCEYDPKRSILYALTYTDGTNIFRSGHKLWMHDNHLKNGILFPDENSIAKDNVFVFFELGTELTYLEYDAKDLKPISNMTAQEFQKSYYKLHSKRNICPSESDNAPSGTAGSTSAS